MNSLWIVAGGVGIALLIALLASLGKLVARQGELPGPEWLLSYRSSRYRPMERLLRESDFRFLASEPGFRPELARRLRASRRRILRQYLRLVRRDFDRLYTVGKTLVVHSAEDRSEFAAALLRQRLTFLYAVTAVQVRLWLDWAGTGTIDVRGLVDALESLRVQVRQLMPVAVGA